MRGGEDVGLDPARRCAGRLGQSSREGQHARAEIDADHLIGTLIPQRKRVATARALEVDRPAAAPVEVADQLGLDPEQVRPAGADQRDRLVEPRLVPFGCLVPGRPIGVVHPCHVGELGAGRPADEPLIVIHRRSVLRK